MKKKKNTVQLSVNVFSRKEQNEDTIFTSLTRDRPGILRGHPSEAKSSCLQTKAAEAVCSVILRLYPKYRSGNRIHDRPPFSQMFQQMN